MFPGGRRSAGPSRPGAGALLGEPRPPWPARQTRPARTTRIIAYACGLLRRAPTGRNRVFPGGPRPSAGGGPPGKP